MKDKEMKEEKELKKKQDDHFYIIKKFSPVAKIAESHGLGQGLWDGRITVMMPHCEICQGGDGISHQCNYSRDDVKSAGGSIRMEECSCHR